MAQTRSILITGATGKQGGAVVRALLDQRDRHGYRVRFLTRNPQSPAAQALVAGGAEAAAGDFNDPASLERAAAGADALFAVSTFFEQGVAAETRQGIQLIDAARRAGVRHVVYTSVGSADQATGIPHFDSKYEVERHLAASGLSYTILGPVYFMENLFFPQSAAAIRGGVLASPLPPDRKLQQVAVGDIGRFAALVLGQPERFAGQRFDLASDELSGTESAAILSRALGREIRYQQIPLAAIRAMSEDMAIMYDWFIRVGYRVDIEGLRRSYPEVGWRRFADWLREQDLRPLSPEQSAT